MESKVCIAAKNLKSVYSFAVICTFHEVFEEPSDKPLIPLGSWCFGVVVNNNAILVYMLSISAWCRPQSPIAGFRGTGTHETKLLEGGSPKGSTTNEATTIAVAHSLHPHFLNHHCLLGSKKLKV